MIRINLAPIDEIENKLWFVSDLVVAAAVLGLTIAAAQFRENQLNNDISTLHRKTAEHTENSKRLQPTLNRYNDLISQKALLEEKIQSLEKITVSKIERYKPVILLEHLQNIKPEGLWFVELKESSKDETIMVQGSAFDNLLVAEFMSALDSTRFQDADPSDMRSQIFFQSVNLDIVSSKESVSSSGSPTNDGAAKVSSLSSKGAASPQDNLEEFVQENPEFARFPMFRLNLKYASRSHKSAGPPTTPGKGISKAGEL